MSVSVCDIVEDVVAKLGDTGFDFDGEGDEYNRQILGALDVVKFITDQSHRIESLTLVRELETDPDLSHIGYFSNVPVVNAIFRENAGHRECRYFVPALPEYGQKDMERAEAYGHSWWMIGIYAKATVSYVVASDSPANTVRRLEYFRSGGLWGIETDSDEEYIQEVERDELHDLRQHLASFGVECPSKEEMLEQAERIEK